MSLNPTVAIIAGTGFEDAFGAVESQQSIRTPYGNATLATVIVSGKEILFSPRHGRNHSLPPHKINYRAQMWALKELGVRDIMATAAAGSLRLDRQPGDMIVLDDFIDFRGQVTTIFDGDDGAVEHTDFSEPFSSKIRTVLLKHARGLTGEFSLTNTIFERGTYLCVAGPRYETPAEVRVFGQWGADVVGMTVAPEAVLAKELNMCYAAVAVVTNLGTGLSSGELSHSEVSVQMNKNRGVIAELFRKSVQPLLSDSD